MRLSLIRLSEARSSAEPPLSIVLVVRPSQSPWLLRQVIYINKGYFKLVS